MEPMHAVHLFLVLALAGVAGTMAFIERGKLSGKAEDLRRVAEANGRLAKAAMAPLVLLIFLTGIALTVQVVKAGGMVGMHHAKLTLGLLTVGGLGHINAMLILRGVRAGDPEQLKKYNGKLRLGWGLFGLAVATFLLGIMYFHR
ncbi:MAG: hypothetical protein H6683_10255 [Deltaproteobacteria bacterium]|nr:hypothetical protein [Deltaproteobacteria bacterium]MCB9480052.1 hypothetical protein [Deltaproteobacteria bacterium]